MMNEVDPYLIIGGVAFAMSLLLVIFTISKSKSRAVLNDQIKQKRQALIET